MTYETLERRLARVLAHAPELAAYERWLEERRRAASEARDYLFLEEKPRFEPRKDDVVLPLPGLAVAARGGARFVCSAPRVDLPLPGVEPRQAESVLSALDGERCLLEVRWHAGVGADVLARILRAAFGRVLFAPRAVEALETQVSGVEITRFPSPPYAIERPYWDNMVAVRRHFEARAEAALGNLESFVALLRELHVLALLGETFESFYKPASPVSDRIVAPGALFVEGARFFDAKSGPIYLDGPRVNAALVGGAGYCRRLFESLGDPGAYEDERAMVEGGLGWGRLVHARSEKDEATKPWFIPPRPIAEGHLELLRVELLSARAAHEPLRALARFHRAFVRLHPFHCANQSLAMNLVNAVLRRTHGAGLPHLLLDHHALRLTGPAYEQLFARAVEAYVLAETGLGPGARLATLGARHRAGLALMDRLTKGEAGEADPEAERAALLA